MRMGVFAVDIQIAKPTSRPLFTEVRRVLVDTGSEATWIAAEALQKCRVAVPKKDQPFVMANGQHVTRHVG